MSPADYYDWWCFSGICPGIATRPANYAVLRERLSAAGVSVVILWELLVDNADWTATPYLTPNGIYGCRERIADAARVVGATRLAEYLPLFPDTDIIPETHRELKKLVKRFAAQHEAELAADITRHGDPRTVPGFDKRKANKEREQLWVENNRRHAKSDCIPFYAEPLIKLRELLAKGATAPELALADESVATLATVIRCEFPMWAQEPQPPDVQQFLDECRRLAEQYPKQLGSWPAQAATLAPPLPAIEISQDPAILEQLRAIGEYTADRLGPVTMIQWKTVSALDNDVAPMQLMFQYEGEFPLALLTTWTTAQAQFAAALPRMKRELMKLARADAKRIDDAEFRPKNEELFSQINNGVLQLIADSLDPSGCLVQCSWDVEWDPEHGCTFAIDKHSGIRRVE